jgi:hypothetical protein
MGTRHSLAWTVGLFILGVGGALDAQQAGSTTALPVGVTGTADVGGSFQGQLLVIRFESLPTNDGIVAVGSMTGSLNGQSLATKVAIPITVTPGSALQTATIARPASCETIRVTLQPSAFRAVGAVVTLARSGVEITAPQGSGSAVSQPFAASATTTAGIGTPGVFPTSNPTSGAAGSMFPSAPVGSATPGVISPPPQTQIPAFATSLQQLGQSLCSVSGLAQSSSSPAQLADALNRVMVVLQQ